MKLYVKYMVLMISTIMSTNMMAQDARIAHPFLWNSYYNPAYCGSEGVFKFDFGAQTTYTHKPTTFVDSYLSTEIGVEYYNVVWGFGLIASNEYQGSGLLNISKISPCVSVGLRMGDDNTRPSGHIRVGLQSDISSNHTNKDRMIFSDQLDPYYGLINNQSAELQYIENGTVWGADLGVGLFGQIYIPADRFRNPAIINYGFSAFNLIGSNRKSFYTNQEAQYLPNLYNRRFCAQLEYAQPYISKKGMPMYFKGYAIYQYQSSMHDIQFGLIYNIYRFMAGVGFKIQQYVGIRTDSSGKIQQLNKRFPSDGIIHFVYTHPVNPTLLLRLAYSCEIPFTQKDIRKTTIHSLSLHLVWNYIKGSGIRTKSKCPPHIDPSDVSWYEANNTFPTKSRK